MTDLVDDTGRALTRRAYREGGLAPQTGAMAIVQPPAGPASAATGDHEPLSADPELATAEEPATTQPPRARGVLSAIVSGLLIGLLVIIGAIAALAIVVPAATGATALTVLTSSMEPTLPPGTMVVVRPTDPAEIRAGDIMTYQLVSGDPTLVTHRVVQSLVLTSGERVFVTQGDNNPTPDLAQVREVQVRGTVWYAIPLIGWVSNAVTGDMRTWLVPGAVGALLIYAFWMIVSWFRDRSRSVRD